MIPALLNPDAGDADAYAQRLANDPRFTLEKLAPDELPHAVRAHRDRGARRILVAGGDGTLATAARELLETPTELAILPAGTLNHFARRMAVPADPAQAIELAAGPATRTVHIGMVNDQPFLNTSSVGAYVTLVRLRERLQPRVGYLVAGAVAAARLLLRLRSFSLELEVDSRRQHYRTPLLLIAVGERELTLPRFTEPADHDHAALHAVVVRSGGRARLLALALATAASGIWRVAGTPHVDSFLVQRCRVELPRPAVHVALDGEIRRLHPPLDYRILPHALTIVAPPDPR